MKILVVPDKFKGSLDANSVCAAVEAGLADTKVSHVVTSIPMADGGEGTCDILTRHSGGHFFDACVVDPLFRKINVRYGVAAGGTTAFIEMAAASGLHLLRSDERDPAETTTYGTGMMIAHAIASGIRQIVLGIGGSATNDGGIGMAAALGYSFLDEKGAPLRPVGKNLSRIKRITLPPSGTPDCSVVVLCDVSNPLFGEHGAATIFAPQKGASLATVNLLDDGLRNLARVVKDQFGIDIDFPGAGAGGGIAGGARFFLNAEIRTGIDYVITFTKLEERIGQYDLVITGEGKLDIQSLSGKVVVGISRICERHGKPLLVIAGRNELGENDIRQLGRAKVISLVSDLVPEEKAVSEASFLIRQLVHSEFAQGRLSF